MKSLLFPESWVLSKPGYHSGAYCQRVMEEQCLCFFLFSLGPSSCAWSLNPSWFYFLLATLPLPFDVCMIQISEPYVTWPLVEIKFRKNGEVFFPPPVTSIWPPESQWSLFFSSTQMRYSSSIYRYWNPNLKL